MGDNLVLRFQFKGKDTDVVVADVEKVNLLDLIHDYWDSAEKEENPMPKYPWFTYLHNLKHEPLTTDVHLLRMFSNLPRRDLIYIWVGESTKPSPVVTATIKLRETKQQTYNVYNDSPKTPTNDQTCKPNQSKKSLTKQPTPKKQQVIASPRRSSRLMAKAYPCNANGTPMESDVTYSSHSATPQILTYNVGNNNPPLYPNDINDLIVDNMDYWKDIEVEPFQSNMESGLDKGKGKAKLQIFCKGKGSKRGRGPEPSNSIVNEAGHSTSHVQKSSPLKKKRVPRTTAISKGTWVPKTVSDGKKKCDRKRSAIVDLSNDVEDLTTMSDEDELYSLSVSDQSDNDTDCTLEDEVDLNQYNGDEVNDNLNDIVSFVHDDFDPFDGPIWEDDCDDLDNYIQRLYNNGEFYKDEGFGNIVLKPWLLFSEKQELRDVIRDYCIQSGFSIVVERASNMQYTVRCSDLRCEWRLHASKLVDGVTWAIKSIEPSEHTCMSIETDNSMVSANWAAKALLEDIRANNDIPGSALNDLLWNRYKVQMKKSSLYRAKKAALYEIHGGYDTSYTYLPTYCDVIKATNPSSVAHCSWYPKHHPERPLVFSSIFICFKACLDGVIAGCRGVIGVDGTFLKGNFGGVLLSAIALDGNNEMFPMAWAIVSTEDEETWSFFIWHLKNILQHTERGDKWCIISDRHKAIDKACSSLWPEVDRRFCAKHLSVNWKKVFSGPKMWQLFWLAAGAYSEFTFRKAMVQIEKYKPAARIWLANLGEQARWTKHKFNPYFKCDVNKTNFVESFNATLGIDRSRPVLTLLENLRRVSMVRLATRKELCER